MHRWVYIAEVVNWAQGVGSIDAILLAGDFAKGISHKDAKLEIVVVTPKPELYCSSNSWLRTFGKVLMVKSTPHAEGSKIAVVHHDGTEALFHITDARCLYDSKTVRRSVLDSRALCPVWFDRKVELPTRGKGYPIFEKYISS